MCDVLDPTDRASIASAHFYPRQPTRNQGEMKTRRRATCNPELSRLVGHTPDRPDFEETCMRLEQGRVAAGA